MTVTVEGSRAILGPFVSSREAPRRKRGSVAFAAALYYLYIRRGWYDWAYRARASIIVLVGEHWVFEFDGERSELLDYYREASHRGIPAQPTAIAVTVPFSRSLFGNRASVAISCFQRVP